MLTKTRGIVLVFIRYKESSIIARIYTKDLGLRSYIVNGVRSIKTSKIAFFQPLTVLDGNQPIAGAMDDIGMTFDLGKPLI